MHIQVGSLDEANFGPMALWIQWFRDDHVRAATGDSCLMCAYTSTLLMRPDFPLCSYAPVLPYTAQSPYGPIHSFRVQCHITLGSQRPTNHRHVRIVLLERYRSLQKGALPALTALLRTQHGSSSLQAGGPYSMHPALPHTSACTYMLERQ